MSAALLPASMAAVSAAQAQQAEIEGWLAQAEEYVAAERLLLPVGGNAYEVLQQVLDREPGNAQAHVLLEAIKDRLYARAEAAQGQAQRLWTGKGEKSLQCALRIHAPRG